MNNNVNLSLAKSGDVAVFKDSQNKDALKEIVEIETKWQLGYPYKQMHVISFSDNTISVFYIDGIVELFASHGGIVHMKNKSVKVIDNNGNITDILRNRVSIFEPN